ncbi:MAG: hypothetical protein BXU00_02820 [Candidatus Nanoclepta minutus]|uniref:Glycosyltransferase 2-like domain-containing protein n=1 Tax=Candidatus Nanoclepta minutus TaxID=1940235 RepID=A0A397WMC2_9ARCH|nr:MAG: hypothetical protein BXU00_02820 [Candidatus Nanoclepta minutus]
MKLGIYGTIYNNADTVKTTIKTLVNSIEDLFDEIIFVITDNYSDDGTYEKLLELKKEYENSKIKIEIIREKSTRGKGRQIAMEYLINNYDIDFVTYTDFDITYYPFQRDIFKAIIDNIKDYEIWGGVAGLATYKTYKRILERGIEWPDTNFYEDNTFFYLISTKAKILIKDLCTIGHSNAIVYNINREKRYAKTTLRWIKRYLKTQLDILRSSLTIWRDIINMKNIAFGRKIFNLAKGINAHYLLENMRIYILPEEVGLPENTFYRFSTYAPRMLLAKIIDDKKAKFIKTRGFHFFRDLKFAKKFIEDHEKAIYRNFDFDINKVEIYKISEIFEKVPYLIHY